MREGPRRPQGGHRHRPGHRGPAARPRDHHLRGAGGPVRRGGRPHRRTPRRLPRAHPAGPLGGAGGRIGAPASPSRARPFSGLTLGSPRGSLAPPTPAPEACPADPAGQLCCTVMQEMHEAAGEAHTRPALLTTRDVQQIIRVDKSTIYRMAETGRIPAVKVGRQWRFPEDRLQEWLQNGPVATGAVLRTGRRPRRTAPAASLPERSTPWPTTWRRPPGPWSWSPTSPAGRWPSPPTPAGCSRRCTPTPGCWNAACSAGRNSPASWTSNPAGGRLRSASFAPAACSASATASRAWSWRAGSPPPNGLRRPKRSSAWRRSLGVPPAVVRSHLGEVYSLGPEERERVLGLLPRTAVLVSRLVEAGAAGWAVGPAAADPSQRSPM